MEYGVRDRLCTKCVFALIYDIAGGTTTLAMKATHVVLDSMRFNRVHARMTMYIHTTTQMRACVGLTLYAVCIVCAFVALGGCVLLVGGTPRAAFSSATSFNQDLSEWDTGAATTMVGSACDLSASPPFHR